jgi:hypothetical protein
MERTFTTVTIDPPTDQDRENAVLIIHHLARLRELGEFALEDTIEAEINFIACVLRNTRSAATDAIAVVALTPAEPAAEPARKRGRPRGSAHKPDVSSIRIRDRLETQEAAHSAEDLSAARAQLLKRLHDRYDGPLSTKD